MSRQFLLQILQSDRFTLNSIRDIHFELKRVEVFNELEMAMRDHVDRYVVELRKDIFFRGLFGGETPQVVMITRFGGEVIIDPVSMNRRNRRQTLHRLIRQ
jgi:hypothetical protein